MKSTRTVLVSLLLGALLVGAVALSGCAKKDAAATVNGAAISLTQLNQQLDQLKKQYPNMFTGADGEGRLLDFKQRLLDNLINQKLIDQAAKDKGITVSDADVAKQVDQLKAGFKDNTQFESALKSAGMTLASLTEQIRQQLMTQKLIETLSANTKVTQADIQAYYDKNKAQFFQKAAKRASHILFKPEDKATALKVLAQLKSGANFAALAKKYSVDTATASKGGDLGWPSTPYVPEFETALAKLSKGQMSGLVKSPYGWHIIFVTDVRKGTQQSLAEVKAQIEQIIVQQRKADAYQQFLTELRKKAKIVILVDDLKAGAAKSSTTTTSSTTATSSK